MFPEDYALWLKLIQTDDIIFGNIGTVLVHLRKHQSNISGGGDKMAIEVELKQPFISEFIEDDLESVCREFVMITGRSVQEKTF